MSCCKGALAVPEPRKGAAAAEVRTRCLCKVVCAHVCVCRWRLPVHLMAPSHPLLCQNPHLHLQKHTHTHTTFNGIHNSPHRSKVQEAERAKQGGGDHPHMHLLHSAHTTLNNTHTSPPRSKVQEAERAKVAATTNAARQQAHGGARFSERIRTFQYVVGSGRAFNTRCTAVS